MESFYHKDLDFLTSSVLSLPNWSLNKALNPYDGFHFPFHFKIDDTPSPNLCSQRDVIYIEMAKLWSKNSYCQRMKVGCLIVKDKSIISDGYNGTPSGFPNFCEDKENNTLPLVLHAEANAITKLAKGTRSSEGSTLYVTLSPCFECSKLIIQSGIKKIFFVELYRNPDPIFFLAEAGIQITKLTPNQI